MANINSGTIKAVLSLTSRNVTNDVLNLKVNDALVILEDVVQKRVVLSTTASLIVSSGFSKSYVFVNNVSTTAIKLVKSNDGDEYMYLSPGEWSWFPWSCSIDLMAKATTGTPTLEVMIFEQGLPS